MNNECGKPRDPFFFKSPVCDKPAGREGVDEMNETTERRDVVCYIVKMEINVDVADATNDEAHTIVSKYADDLRRELSLKGLDVRPTLVRDEARIGRFGPYAPKSVELTRPIDPRWATSAWTDG